MNAVEKLQAAIDKLTGWKSEPQPPFLVYFDPETMNDGDNDDTVSTAFSAGITWGKWRERVRVADAQLDWLKLTVDNEFADWLSELQFQKALALADAILGDNA